MGIDSSWSMPLIKYFFSEAVLPPALVGTSSTLDFAPLINLCYDHETPSYPNITIKTTQWTFPPKIPRRLSSVSTKKTTTISRASDHLVLARDFRLTMASLELQRSSGDAEHFGSHNHDSGKNENNINKMTTTTTTMRTRTKKKKKFYVPRFACFRADRNRHSADISEMAQRDSIGEQHVPTHLVVTVNGIIGSADNWRFAAKQFVKKYPEDVLVHCSKSNCSMLTFDGVDVMGERLAEEVISVIKRRPELQKISFVGHSLGGLIARYAIARLYGRDAMKEPSEENGDCRSRSGNSCLELKLEGKIAGLEPMNFITFATPHLGSRGHRQVPLFCGLNILEKTAPRISWILGRTGRHLSLTDNDNGKPPLLLQMVTDSGDLPFMSALQSFTRRVAYANSCYDHLVGWRTSSIRRQNELPMRKKLLKNDKYPHIVNVEAPKTASQQEVLAEAAVKDSPTVDMEEAMIRGLTKVSWERVDVSFSRSKQRFFAHSTIQVKTYLINSDGADVIFHMIDNFAL